MPEQCPWGKGVKQWKACKFTNNRPRGRAAPLVSNRFGERAWAAPPTHGCVAVRGAGDAGQSASIATGLLKLFTALGWWAGRPLAERWERHVEAHRDPGRVSSPSVCR